MEGGDRSQQAGTTRRVMRLPDSKVLGPCARLPHFDREESKTVEWGHISSLLCFFKSYLIKKHFTESWKCHSPIYQIPGFLPSLPAREAIRG